MTRTQLTLDIPARVAAWLESQPGGASAWVTVLVQRLAGFRQDAGESPNTGGTDTRRGYHAPDCLCNTCRPLQEVERRLKLTLSPELLAAVERRRAAESLSQGDALRAALREGLPAIRPREDGRRGLLRGRAAAGQTVQRKVRLTRDLELRLSTAARLAGVNLAEAARQALEAGLQAAPAGTVRRRRRA